MTTDLSRYDVNELPSADVLQRQRYAIVVADWNSEITHALAQGAIDTLVKHGVQEDKIEIMHVPGTVELTYGAAQYVSGRKTIGTFGVADAVIVIGCVIKGDTPHFDYICEGATQGLATLNATGQIPVVNGILTVNNMQQAEDRTGGVVGDKGEEFAITAIKMIDFAWQIQK